MDMPQRGRKPKVNKLTRAEIQKRYRDRQKEKDKEEFLRKDRDRQRRKYIPVANLNEQEIIERRKQVNVSVKQHYKRKKSRQQNVRTENSEEPCEFRRVTRRSGPLLNLCLPAVKCMSMKKQHNLKSIALQRSTIKLLESKNKEREKKIKNLQQKLRRRYPGKKQFNCKISESGTSTPKTKMEAELRQSGLSPRKVPALRRKILLANIVMEDAKRKRSPTVLRAGKIIKIYKCTSLLCKETGHCFRTVKRNPKKYRECKKRQFYEMVINFLEREDNCTLLPGKKDVKKCEKIPYQKRILNDDLNNLYAKFSLENPHVKISRSLFCQMRPSYIMTANFASRKTCLCSKHQNIALKLRAIKSLVPCKSNPDQFIKENNDVQVDELLDSIVHSNVRYMKWCKVKEESKMRWKLLQIDDAKEKFITDFKAELSEFRAHVNRVNNQYQEMKRLRENLKKDEMLVWMDFAENFSCSVVEEVQSAYWNSEMVSLHTTVVYYTNEDTTDEVNAPVKHQSFVAVSHDLQHNAIAVYAIIRKLVPLLKELHPDLRKIFYLTDSPTSQYRNKTIFQVVTYHLSDFEINARWDYLESGHGKGPCDGLGGSVKRSADAAVRQGKAVLQSAADFYAWSQSAETSTVKYFFVSKEDIKESENILNTRKANLKAVPGTFKIHAVLPERQNIIKTRWLSCYCQECHMSPNTSACEWMTHPLMPDIVQKDVNDQENEDQQQLQCDINDWVIAEYDSKWYVGQILKVNTESVNINFMEERKKKFKWPVKRDILDVVKSHIVYRLMNSPIPRGRYKRSFSIDDVIIDEIENAFEKWQKIHKCDENCTKIASD